MAEDKQIELGNPTAEVEEDEEDDIPIATDINSLAENGYVSYMKSVSEDVHKNYHACFTNLVGLRKLILEAEKAKYEAEKKLNEEARKIFDRNAQIISGESLPTEAEMKDYQKSTEIVPLEGSQFNKGIPAFWYIVLKNSVIFDAANGNEQDAKILLHLKNITIEYLPLEDCKLKEDDKEIDSIKYTYKVNFFFEKNDYFTNEVLTLRVECKLGSQPGEFEEPSIVLESPIEWNKEKDPRYKTVKRRGGRRGGKARPTAIRQKVDSFFDLFYTPALPETIDDGDEINEDIIICHTNFKIMLELISSTYVNALGYFDETMVDDEDEDDGFDENEFGDEDDEEDDDNEVDPDEDDDDEEEEKPKAAAPKKGDNLNAPPVPQECPQQ